MWSGLFLGSVIGLGGPTIGAIGAQGLARARAELGREAFVTGSPQCPPIARWCIELALHVVEQADGSDVQTPSWFMAHVREANRLFSPIGVGFRVKSVDAVDEGFADLQTRKQRDAIGRQQHSLGVVHVFIVRRLADVDIEGNVIHGVHWRERAEPTKRWIILSSIASPMVLSHEMGHFFGLPHSGYRVSLMNKSPRSDPPWPSRTFHPNELDIMRRRRDEMLLDGTLHSVRRVQGVAKPPGRKNPSVAAPD